MPPIIAIGLSIEALHREHVIKGAAAESSAPESPMAIRARHLTNDISTARKLNRSYFSTGSSDAQSEQRIGSSDGYHVSCQTANGYYSGAV